MKQIADRRPYLCLFVALVALAGPVSIPPAEAATTSYEYDNSGRLVKVTYQNGTVVTYEYDDAGNRVRTTVTPHP